MNVFKRKRTRKGSGSSRGGSNTNENEEVEANPTLQQPQDTQGPISPHACPIWSDDEKDRYDALGRIRFEPTRYFSKEFLEKTGLREDFEKYVRDMGLGKLAHEEPLSYADLTRQFMATIEVAYKRPKKREVDEGLLSFKIFNKRYEISMVRICEAFGFTDGSLAEFPTFVGEALFWSVIGSGEAYNAGGTKASSIRNPVIYLAHRFLAHTIFPRMDTGKIKKNELYLLFQPVRRIVVQPNNNLIHDGSFGIVNLGCVLAKALKGHQKWCMIAKHVPSISTVGGLVTKIMLEAGVPLHLYTPDKEAAPLGIETLMHTKAFQPHPTDNDKVIYHYKDKERRPCTFTLPNRELTTPFNQDNLDFSHVDAAEDGEEGAEPDHHGQPPPTATLEELFQYMNMQQFPYEPATDRERWFVEQREVQNRFNGLMMARMGEYDVLTGRNVQAAPSPHGSHSSAYYDMEEDQDPPIH